MPNELIANLEIKVQKGSIVYDLTPIAAQVATLNELYGNWQVKEEDLAAAKDTAAALNKTSKKLSDARIAAVKEFKQPTEPFEQEIKVQCLAIDNLSKSITEQIAVFDERVKEEKRAQIKSLNYYSDFIQFNERWLNKGCSLSEIINDIQAQTINFRANESALIAVCQANGLPSERYVEQLKSNPFPVVAANVAHDKQIIDASKSAPAPAFVEPKAVTNEVRFGDPVNEEIVAREYVAVGKAYKLDVLERYAADLGIQMRRK